MNFRDVGIIIRKITLKENTSIILAFTQNHGLYSGVVGQLSKKTSSIYQEGNIVDFFWQARLHEHIGMLKCELIKSYNGLLITSKIKLYAFNSVISLIKLAFHEREPHNNFFPIFKQYLHKLSQNFDFQDYIKIELAILTESGYRLELNNCAVTGTTENLCYLSPKSGKAVCASIGLPYADKLLILPKFLSSQVEEINYNEKKQAIDLTSYFFSRYLFHNAQQPEARKILIELLYRS